MVVLIVGRDASTLSAVGVASLAGGQCLTGLSPLFFAVTALPLEPELGVNSGFLLYALATLRFICAGTLPKIPRQASSPGSRYAVPLFMFQPATVPEPIMMSLTLAKW